jgi:RNA polymerase sigma-54 factor
MMMRLSPQQVQYLKMLQLPTLALEQKIKAELEMNPLLEEGFEEELEPAQQDDDPRVEEPTAEEAATKESAEDSYSIDDYMNDDLSGYKAPDIFDSEEKDELPIPDSVPLYHGLLTQFNLLDLDDEEYLIGQEIIGNVDEDGYLRRELVTIVQDLNLTHGTTILSESPRVRSRSV